MARLQLEAQWHSGEEEMHHLLRVPHGDNPTHPGLAPQYYKRITNSPLVAFGTLDQLGRPWTTIWGGEVGFCRPIAQGVLGVNTKADSLFDPVVQETFAVAAEGSQEREIVDEQLVKPEGGKAMAALSIDLETRDRVKVAGRFIAGAVISQTDSGVGELQMAMQVEETLGNCPKYLNKKHITPHTPRPQLLSQDSGLPLPQVAVEVLQKADLFFISSKHGNGNMDVNHRGGPPGFMRLFRNDSGAVTLVYPEYSGNRLYQTLGNLQKDPVAGLVVPDFETGNVLYVTGRTTTLIGDKAAAYLPRTKLAVKIDVEEARFVKDGLPFRGDVIDYSPYNPPVRRLLAEQDPSSSDPDSESIATATLTKREIITPTIARFTFKLTHNIAVDKTMSTWQPGQHVTLDFGPELDHGWSHMRDDDPESLNDDFVRTFTISAPPDPESKELEITARKHGPVTGSLFRWNLRVPLEVPVIGFGGSEEFRLPGEKQVQGTSDDTKQIFVAGGVGITPLMAQAKRVLEARKANLAVLWSLRAEDLPLAVSVFDTIHGLGSVTVLFVTGQVTEESHGILENLRKLGVGVQDHRIGTEDLLAVGEKGKRIYYCCTGTGLMTNLSEWLKGENMVFESFNY
ncbi:hypothetical protein SCAR479_10445 [Seiridium cardinale]|uniref:FAD-binding FR-type domain-containing protein n=1 Tax=Seiridium cardinale TaxID=138064 RepID=A0ABR2XGH5_9PEZI